VDKSGATIAKDINKWNDERWRRRPIDEKNLVGSGSCMIVVLLEEITCYVEFIEKLMLEVED
jgi:hypothetical protein